MCTKVFRRFAALGAVAALSCVFAPSARAVPVASVGDINNALSTWTAGSLPLELAPGTYNLRSTDLPQLAGIGMPGDLTIGPLNTGTAEPVEAIKLVLDFSLRTNGHNLLISQVKLAGAIDTGVSPNSLVSLTRVWIDGDLAPTGIIIRPNSSLVMASCAVTGGVQINCGGAATISRCTFRAGDLNFSSTTQAVSLLANLFEVVPTVTPLATGSINFILGGGNLLEATSPDFALDVGEVLGNTPQFAADAWGKLRFSLAPKVAPLVPLVGLPAVDFEGDLIVTSRNEIGADEVGIAFPQPAWVACQITGPVGATLYVNEAPRSIPIVRGGVPVEIAITARIPDVVASNVVELRVFTEQDLSTFVTTPNPDVIRLDTSNADLNGLFSTVVSYVTPGGADVNGVAEVRLYLDGTPIGDFGTSNPIENRQILIDTVPPALPAFIDATLAPGSIGCGSWTRGPIGLPVGTRPHFMFRNPSYPALAVSFSLDLEDLAPVLPNGFVPSVVAGFDGLARLADDADVVNWPKSDAVFGNNAATNPVGYSGLGNAVWTNDAFNGAPVLPIATSMTPGTGGAASTITWALTFDGPIPPSPRYVVKWDAEIVITDRAGNETPIPVAYSPRFWWMPEGSTFANVTPDNDANNPQFSWSLGMTPGSNASVYDLPSDPACQSSVKLLTCFTDPPLSDPSTSGWTAGPLDWTPSTQIASIDSNTRMGLNGEVSLGDLFAANLGDSALVMVRITDPAGNTQSVAGGIGATNLTATTATATDLNDDNDFFGGIYEIPSRVAEGALDTIASARFFLNRTDRADVSRLWAIDPDETTFGNGPNVPLTPIDACGQRLEAEITVDVAVPDNLPGGVLPGQVGVEFQLFEEGRLVAIGNLVRRDIYSTEPFKLFIPTDLLEGQGNGTTAATQTRGVVTNGVFTPNDFDVAAFLNFPPPPCDSSAGLHRLDDRANSSNGYGDRLGDDGSPETRNLVTGDVVNPYRTRAVSYTLVLTATNDNSSSSGAGPNALFDTTPASIHFFVKPETTTDSGVPPIKSNKKL